MTYEEIVGKSVIVYKNADASAVDGHVAVQFNVTGEAEGAFYLEITDGKVDIQPYEYYDRDAIVTIDTNTIAEILDGKLTINDAYNDSKMTVDGNLGAALLVTRIQLKKKAKNK